MTRAWSIGWRIGVMGWAAWLGLAGLASAQQTNKRVLAPGVLTVITPEAEERETMHSPVPLKEVLAAFQKAGQTKGPPSAILAHTIKGYPISDVIHDPNHHGVALTAEEAQKALAAIG
jgi:transketolase